MKRSCLIILSLVFFLPVLGQTQTEAERVQQQRQIQRDQERQRNNEQIRERRKENQAVFSKQLDTKSSTAEERQRDEEIKRTRESEKVAFIKELSDKTKVPNEYFIKFSEIIGSGKANLLRLFPENFCEDGKTVSVQELERCGDRPQIPGSGSLYSFRLFTLPNYLNADSIKDYIRQSDIHFVDNNLVVGNKLTQDIIADIGDVPLEKLTAKSNEIRFLQKWKRVKNKAQLNEQNENLAKGIEKDGYIFSNSVEVKKETTFILRSIGYFEKFNSFWNTDRIDAFRVVGQESDGSIIILWKNLKEKGCSQIYDCGDLKLAK